MTREMHIILNLLDAILTPKQRETTVKILSLMQNHPVSSNAGADDLRQALDHFQGTLSIRRNPTKPFPLEPEVVENRRSTWLALFDRAQHGDEVPVRTRLARILRDEG